MRLISALVVTAVIASPVFAQEVKIKGNTNIAASQNNTAAIAVGPFDGHAGCTHIRKGDQGG